MRVPPKSPAARALAPRPVPHSLPPILSFVAGYIDSVTFIALFGLFVAQATGSFVVAGAQLAARDGSVIVKILAIPVFLLGAAVTTLLAYWIGERRSALGWALILEGTLIAAFSACALVGPLGNPNAPMSLAASIFALSAMGVQSALVRLLMSGVASTNVMTTNTTLIGIDAAELLIAWQRSRGARKESAAAEKFQAARRDFSKLLAIALGFLIGAGAGALAYQSFGAGCLLAPVATIFALSAWAFAAHPRRG
ncbi:MAG TPA: YoaK family protein [Xanthobacteraceae bacterium]|nr:YoaK family protein [Xanthobacteraceae bacterium]